MKKPDPARHICAYCGDVFLSIHPGRRFCSVPCGRAYNGLPAPQSQIVIEDVGRGPKLFKHTQSVCGCLRCRAEQASVMTDHSRVPDCETA